MIINNNSVMTLDLGRIFDSIFDYSVFDVDGSIIESVPVRILSITIDQFEDLMCKIEAIDDYGKQIVGEDINVSFDLLRLSFVTE